LVADAGRLFTGVAPVSAALTELVTDGGSPSPTVWAGMLLILCGLAVGLATNPTVKTTHARQQRAPRRNVTIEESLT
jgi:hypothetical protein